MSQSLAPSSMKLPASRSLLHGTVPSSRMASARPAASNRGLRPSSPAGSREPPARVQATAGAGHARDSGRIGHVLVAQRPALDIAEDQQPVLRPVLDDR